MIFGRVEAIATDHDSELVHITVYLESGRGIRAIRDEWLGLLRPIGNVDDLVWHADQYAQETIANELTLEGWEVIGAGDIPAIEPGAAPRSATYALRRVGATE